MKALVGAFNQEKALVGAFSVIVQPVVEPMEHYTALIVMCHVSRVTSHAPARGHGLQLVLPLELSAREVRVVDLVALVPEDVARRVVVVARHRGLPG